MSEADRSSSRDPSRADSDVRSRMSGSRHGEDIELEPLHDEQETEKPRPKSQPRYHKRAIFLLSLYLPLIIVPWALTCVMSKRPLTASSYYNQHGFEDIDIDRIEKWVLAVNVLNSIASLITIPVLSALVAQAVAVYSQKHFTNDDYHLQYLVAFADRGWTDPLTLAKSCKWPKRGSNGARNLLFFAAIAVIIGSIQQPLYQILVPMESILVPTCQDTKYMGNAYKVYHTDRACSKLSLPPRVLGWDMEPTQMSLTYQDEIFQEILSELSVARLGDLKPHLWNDTHRTEVDRMSLSKAGSGSFVATLEQGTSTGVLRQHIARLNSSVTCERIERSAFPSPCPGEKPFTRTLSHEKNLTRICVPGKRGSSPWTMSRSRQDIHEELFLDILEECELGTLRLNDFRNLTSDFTLHCTAATTRGYFELGNYRNNQTWGPLLSTWPSPEEMQSEYNDYFSYHGRLPTEYADAPDHIYPDIDYVPGPLTMASIALFGNNTFFDMATQVWNSSLSADDVEMLSGERLCNLVPFPRLAPVKESSSSYTTSGDRGFPDCETATRKTSEKFTAREFLSKWLHGFNNTDTAITALTAAVFLANQAVLTTDQWSSRFGSNSGRSAYGRHIYSGFGTTVRKPKLSVGVTAAMSCILVLEVLCLAILGWLVYRGPSESPTLDVMAFTRLKERMEEHRGLLVESDSI